MKLLVLAWLAWSFMLLLMLSVLCPFLRCLYWSEPSVLRIAGGVHRGCKYQRIETKATLEYLLPPPGSSGLQKGVSRCLPTSHIPGTLRGLIQMQYFYHYLLAFTDCCDAQITLASCVQSNEVVKLDFWWLCLTGWKDEGSKNMCRRKRNRCLLLWCIHKHNLAKPPCCTDQALNRNEAHQSLDCEENVMSAVQRV